MQLDQLLRDRPLDARLGAAEERRRRRLRLDVQTHLEPVEVASLRRPERDGERTPELQVLVHVMERDAEGLRDARRIDENRRGRIDVVAAHLDGVAVQMRLARCTMKPSSSSPTGTLVKFSVIGMEVLERDLEELLEVGDRPLQHVTGGRVRLLGGLAVGLDEVRPVVELVKEVPELV